MTNPDPRHVTLRHASSGPWCIEVPHPTVPTMPQPFVLKGRMSFSTLAAAAVRHIEASGCVVVRNPRTGIRTVYHRGVPLTAEQQESVA